MAIKQPSHSSAKPTYRVGDRIKMLLGERWAEGVIVEDRGPIGVGGRRLYRITIPLPPAEPLVLEGPAEWFVAAE